MRSQYKILAEKYELVQEVDKVNEGNKEKRDEKRKEIVAASRQGDWRPWLENLAADKNKPSREWRWEITVDYLLELWPKDNKCPILKTTFTLLDTPDYNPNSPSIDRINANLHYVPGNVKIISSRANTIKGEGTANEINAVAEWMRVRGATPDPYFK
jgi:hypothetical protein